MPLLDLQRRLVEVGRIRMGEKDGNRPMVPDDGPGQGPPSHEERPALAAKGKACKATTRLSVRLPDVPGIGCWRLETHGYYAAVELAATADIIERATAQGVMLPA